MLEYCKQDVKLTEKLYRHLVELLGDEVYWKRASLLEHQIAVALRDAKDRGFYFNANKALDLRQDLEEKRNKLDEIIQEAYPPVEVGKRKKKLVYFNPNSSKQIIDKLWEAGWKPVEMTDGHKEVHVKWKNDEKYQSKVERYKLYGWKINEVNLSTLPKYAPKAVKCFLKRTILETRIRKLDEWLGLVEEDGAIHGKIIGLGASTHRMIHHAPNMANVSAHKSIKYHTEELNSLAKDLGGKLRQLWIARPGYVLVGTDAEGIQLRVLAHYMNDKDFIKAVTEGTKEDETDPHSLNRKKIGLGTRDNAKTFIYAFLLGAGDGKIAEIYNLKRTEGGKLKQDYINSIPGLKKLKNQRIPIEALYGYTIGFDGRKIKCDSEHLMMAMYLQGGEAIVMKTAVILSIKELHKQGIEAYLINVIHDEMIFECQEKDADKVKEITEWSIQRAGEILKLKCPMKGEGKIGFNWLEVH